MGFIMYVIFFGFSCNDTTCSQFGEQTIGSILCTNTCVVTLVPFSRTTNILDSFTSSKSFLIYENEAVRDRSSVFSGLYGCLTTH